MTPQHEITPADIMPMDDYAAVRAERRKAMGELKKNRRVAVGPDATFYFESYDTMFHQVHEMLYIEKGGDGQIADELSAYNPLIPNGRELVATLMFEIDEPVRRAAFLAGLGGVEETVSLAFEGETIEAVPNRTWTGRRPRARRRRSSSCTFRSRPDRSRRSAPPAPRSPSASAMPSTATRRCSRRTCGWRWPRTSTEASAHKKPSVIYPPCRNRRRLPVRAPRTSAAT